jgi:hypothetical protein
MMESQVLSSLHALRASIRYRLLLYGLCVVLACGAASFIVLVALDWLLWLPPLLRIAGDGVFLTAIIWAALHWIVKPLQARLGVDEIAARIEAHFTALQDRLLSTVNFIEQRSAGSASLMQKVIADTEEIIKTVPLGSALTLRPLALRAILAAASVTVLAAISGIAPDWSRVGLYRYVYPWGKIEWPKAVSVLPLTGDLVAAIGESVTVRMRVSRGLHDSLRGVVHLRERDGATISLAMQREGDTFSATIDAVTKDLEYWFEAGDDSTEQDPYALRVIPRPQVVEALATVEPPAYAAGSAVRVQDLSDGPVRAPIGGFMQVTVRASKPVPWDAPGNASGLRTETGEWIPLAVAPEDHQTLSARFEVGGDLNFWIELRDEYGFENRGAARHSILAVPDAPPVVTVLEPKAVTELTPRGSVLLVIRIEDDFGLTGADLNVERVGGDTVPALSLTNRLDAIRSEEGVEGRAEYVWSVASMSFAPGDTVLYSVSATDNRSSPDAAGQVGRSAPMRIKIISDLEFDVRLRQDMALIEARLREAALDEADLLDRTTGLLNPPDQPQALTNAQREVSALLASRQGRLIWRLRELGDRSNQLGRRMEHNQAGDEEVRKRVASLGDALERIASGPMTTATEALAGAREQGETEAQQRNLHEAARNEEIAVNGVQAIIRLMSQWGSFHELVTKTKDLLDRQNSVRGETAELGKAMLGKAVESLTKEEAAKLKRTARQQEQLTTDLEQLLARMERVATATREKDPSTADAIDAAVRAASAHEAARYARAAAKAIQANRTAAATVDQQAAAEALRKMVAAMHEREARELELLRKRLGRAEEQVAALIEQQQTLRAATHEAGLVGADETALGDLEQEQRTVKRNTKLLGDELLEVERATGAVRLVRQAATPMELAETGLRERQPQAATTGQDEAIGLLRDALAEFEALAREAAQQAIMRSLEQIREDLDAILAGQLEVNRGIGELQTAIAARGRLGRAETRAASELARRQGGVRSMVKSQLPDFERVAVYRWALERVAVWMDTSRNRLEVRQIDDELVSTTDRIARELQKLINAIVETAALPMDTDFVESDGGGGGGEGQMRQSKPVPTVAELLVLKAMQADINERTKTLNQSFDAESAMEEQLRGIRMLGEDQAEVRRLTELVVERAQHP